MVARGRTARREELEGVVETILNSYSDDRHLTLTQETQSVDFKEEANRRGHGGEILQGLSQNPDAAVKLANEVACMANTPGGGALIYGVEDKTGRIIGTELDVDWLRDRIYEQIDIAADIQERRIAGQRVLVLFIAESHEPIADEGGRIRWRVGDKCQPVDRAEWWQHQSTMLNHDEMAQASRLGIEDVRPAAMRIAKDWLSQDELNRTDEEFLRHIGALRSDGKLSEAAALFFCSVNFVAVELTQFDVPGGSILNRVVPSQQESLAEQIYRVESALDVMNSFVTVNDGLADKRVRRVPRDAVREAMLNGLIHRDWNLTKPTELRWTDHDSSLEVSSPGGFMPGIDEDNVLSQREARYPALADLIRAIGLVDKQGVGVDRMYRAQIALGHRPPEITQLPGPYVRTVLVGGQPVTPVVKLVDGIRPAERQKDYRLAILLFQLLHQPFINIEILSKALQATSESARNTLEVARQTTVGDGPLVKRYQSVWLLGDSALQIIEAALEKDTVYDVLEYRGTDEYQLQRTVDTWLKHHLAITTGELMTLSGVARGTAKRVLDALVEAGQLSAEGKGRSSRYERK